jgi:hypothetical protein
MVGCYHTGAGESMQIDSNDDTDSSEIEQLTKVFQLKIQI